MLVHDKDKLDLKIGQRSLEAEAVCLNQRQEIENVQRYQEGRAPSSL